MDSTGTISYRLTGHAIVVICGLSIFLEGKPAALHLKNIDYGFKCTRHKSAYTFELENPGSLYQGCSTKLGLMREAKSDNNAELFFDIIVSFPPNSAE